MKKLFSFSNVFAKVSLSTFLMCMAFVSCNKNAISPGPDTPKPVETQDYTWMGLEEFEKIISDPAKINDYFLLDVRRIVKVDGDKDEENGENDDSYEYQKGHTFCGVSIPFDSKEYKKRAEKNDQTAYTDAKIFDSTLIDDMKDKNIIIQCRTKNRSPQVAKILKTRGFKKLFVAYGTKGYTQNPPNESKMYNKENLTRIPAIRKSQIASIQGVKVLDVRSKEDFDKGTYQEGSIKAEHCADPAAYAITKDSRIVVIASNAIDAYKAAKQLEKKLPSGLGSNKVLLETSPVRICVESFKAQ